MANKLPEPKIIPFFSRGLFTNRQPLYAALSPVGVNVLKFDDALIDGINMECSDHLTLQRAPGWVKYCTQQLGAGEIVNHFYSVRNISGTVFPLVDTNLALYLASPTTLTTIITKTVAAQSFIQQVGNMVYITDGTDLFKWDTTLALGSTYAVTSWGIAAPSSTPVLQNTLTTPGYWIPSTSYTAGGSLLDVNGNIEYATATGVSDGAIPVWNTVIGGSVTNNTAVWENVGPTQNWVASTAYIKPTAVLDINGYIQLVTTAGTSGAAVPSWSKVQGVTTADGGSLVWTNIGPGTVIAYAGYSYVYAFRTIHGNLSTASPASLNTGPILSSVPVTPITITSWSITSNVATYQAANTLTAGQSVVLSGFTAGYGYNGQTVVVLSSGLSATQFKANFVSGNGGGVEIGYANPVIALISGRQSINVECNATAMASQVAINSNILTITCINNFTPGLNVLLSGLTNATFLNGLTLNINTATSKQFTATIQHADYQATADNGTVTFLAVEIYRTNDGGGVYYFDGATLNPTNAGSGTFDSTVLTVGAGVDNGLPGTNAWTNPNNVTSAGSYATCSYNPPSSGSGTVTIIQSGTGLAHYNYSKSKDTYSNGPSAVSATLSLAPTAGNTLILVVMNDSSGTISAPTDTRSNSYTLVKTQGLMKFYTVTSPSTAGSTTVTCTLGPTTDEIVTMLFMEVSGIVTASTVDVSSGAGGGTSTFNTGSVTTTYAADVIFTAIYNETTGMVQPSGYTLAATRSGTQTDGVSEQLSAAFLPVGSTSTYSPTWTGTESGNTGITVALQANSTAQSNGLIATTFPISVPAGVGIQGIRIFADAKFSGTFGDGTINVTLLKNGAPFGNTKTITPTSANVTYQLGGTADTWGVSWNPSDFTSNTSWGVQFYGIQIPEGGGPYVFSVKNVQAEVNGQYGIATWTFPDISTDANLNNQLVAALFHLNDPPPGTSGSLIATGATVIAFWSNRIWMAVGNAVYFDGGPDILNGIAEECCPPANVFVFPGHVTSLIPTAGGMIVVTPSEWWAILGGPQTISYYPERIFTKFGALSANCIAQDGDAVVAFTSQSQAFLIEGGNREELGSRGLGINLIGDLLRNGQATSSCTATAWSPLASRVAIHRQGEDSGIYINNGVDSIVRFGLNSNNWSPIRQPNLAGTGVGKAGAMASVETTPGNFTLLLASTASNDYIYARSLTTFTDNGHAYKSNVTIGNIVCTEASQGSVPLYGISAYLYNVGSIPSVSFMPNEIFATGTAKFTALPLVQDEPFMLPTSQSVMSKRWPTLANQSATPIVVRHVQVKMDFGGADTLKNELFTLALKFDREQMT